MSDAVPLVVATADDAVLAKAATVKAGYYDDDFVQPLSEKAVGISSGGRQKQFQPIIKKGTHARVSCIDRAIATYLQQTSTERPQIVVLGAGKDTSFYRHVSQSHSLIENVLWFEVDFPSVMIQKAAILRNRVYKSSVVEKGRNQWQVINEWSSKWSCRIIGSDLRKKPDELLHELEGSGFNREKPALFVLECVQMYIPKQSVCRMWRHFAGACRNIHVILYDTIVGQDRFGTVMEQHLLRAGVVSKESCLVQTRTLDDQLSLFTDCGFQQAVGCTMWSGYQTILTGEQRQRANQAEFLDEMEEWMMIMHHYCFVVARTKGSTLNLCKVGPESLLGFQKSSSKESFAIG